MYWLIKKNKPCSRASHLYGLHMLQIFRILSEYFKDITNINYQSGFYKQHMLLTQELLSLVCCKWWLNASLMERKQIVNYQLMVLLITEFYISLQGSTVTVVRLGIPSSFYCRTTWTSAYGCPLVKLRKLIKWIILDRTFINDWFDRKLPTENINIVNLVH